MAVRLYFSKAFIPVLIFILLVCFIIAACFGAIIYSPVELVRIIIHIFGNSSDTLSVQEFVWLNLRLPRLILSMLVGASLAAGGVVMQSLFRNPLAEPALIGISAGGAMMAIIVIVSGLSGFYALNLPLLPGAAFVGCLMVALLIYRFSKIGGRADMHTLLLAGIAFNALATAVIGFFTMIADNSELRSFIFWMLGSFSGVNWSQIATVSIFILPALAVIILSARILDALTLGERNALYLGIHVERWKFLLIIAVSLCVGAAVSISGLIAFVGLIAPHLARSLLGAWHRRLLPAAILIGALLTLLADLFARVIFLPLELPIGILTALLGVPMFLSLILNRRKTITL